MPPATTTSPGLSNSVASGLAKVQDALALKGLLIKKAFDRLCDNLHPFENKRLTQRNHADRRVLSDITFSAPKSVSILWAVKQDSRILEAVEQAAKQTFTDLEQDVLTRVNQRRGQLTTRPTGNLIGASWLHLTSRPVDEPEFGSHPDPQLHVHGAIINATDAGGGRWTAIDLSDVVRDSGYYEALFQSRLASNIQQLGYGVRRSEHNFEIADVSRNTIEKFSRRSTAIDQLVDKGVADKIAEKNAFRFVKPKTSLVPAHERQKTVSIPLMNFRQSGNNDYQMKNALTLLIWKVTCYQ